MTLIGEIRRRKVFRVALVYAATGFVVLQAADLLASGLGLPDWLFPVITVVVILGFPIALVLAWALELTPEGVRRTEARPAAQQDEPAPPLLGKRTVFTAGLLVVLGIGIGAGWFLRSVPAAPSETAGGGPSGAERSIAVLAFANLSTDPENAFFAEGISEEILNLLAAVESLSVASRTSAFSYRDKDVPVSEIASALGVRYVLEGSVRKAGNQVRVTAQLIDAETDRHLWSDTFDRTLDDIFAIQDEIAGAIGDALQVELLGTDGRTVSTAEIEPALYEKFLQSRFLMRQRNETALMRATDLLQEVVEGEPDYAPGLAQLAEAWLLSGGSIDNDPDLQQRLDLILGLVERALASDSSQSGAFAVRGNVAMTRGAYVDALHDYRRAIELDPGDPRPQHWLALVYSEGGRLDLAEQAIAESLRLDPDNANAQGWHAMLLAARGDWNGALGAARRQAALGNPFGHVSQALLLLDMDREANLETAEAELRTAVSRGARVEEVPLEVVAIARGDAAAVDALVERAATDRLWLYVAGPALLALDQPAALLRLLERDDFLYDRLGPLVWSPEHAGMRRDPRFVEYLRRQGVTGLWREIGPPPDCRAEGDSFVCGLADGA